MLKALPEYERTGLISAINTDNPEYQEDLESQIKKSVAPIAAFDCIGGNYANTLLHSLRNGGTLYHYGTLSLRPMAINFGLDFVFQEKTIRTLHLMSYLSREDPDFVLKHWKFISDDLKQTAEGKEEESIFASKIGFEVDFTEFEEAIRAHKKRMGQGKVILKFKE